MKVVIIGAGIAGLAASHHLTALGHEVEVFEAAGRAGGRAQLIRRTDNDDLIDTGTQYFHSNYTEILHLIDALGLQGKRKTITGRTRFYTGDCSRSFVVTPQRPWIKPGGLAGNFKAFSFLLRQLLANRGGTFSAGARQDVLDRLAALAAAPDTFVQDYIVRMLSLVGGLAEPGEANVSLLQIARLARIILTTDYISLAGGTATLHQALADRANVHLDAPVDRLIEENGRVCGIVLQDGREVRADHVIVAAHAPAAARLLPMAWTEERAFLESIAMPPALLVSLFLDRRLEADTWTHFMPLDHQGPVQFFVDTREKSPGNTPSGKATMQAWIVAPKSRELFACSDAEVIAAATRDLCLLFPEAASWIEGAAVTRHRHAVPQAAVGHGAATLRFLERVDSRRGVGFCGDYLSGGYAESALWSVRREIERIKAAPAAPHRKPDTGVEITEMRLDQAERIPA